MHDKAAGGYLHLNTRPDILFNENSASHFVVVEVDEFQHAHEQIECCVKRMFEITQTLGKPGVWIRFNPDLIKGQDDSTSANGSTKSIRNQLLSSVRHALENRPEKVVRVDTINYTAHRNKAITDEVSAWLKALV